MEPDRPPSGPVEIAVRVVAAVVLLGFAALTFVFGLFAAMASDGCGPHDPRLICTAGGQLTVTFVPLCAALAAAALTVWGVLTRRPSGLLGVLAAGTLLLASWVVVLAVL